MFFFFSVMSAAALRVLRCGRVCDAHDCGITLLVAILGERAMAQRFVTAQPIAYQSPSPGRLTIRPKVYRIAAESCEPLANFGLGSGAKDLVGARGSDVGALERLLSVICGAGRAQALHRADLPTLRGALAARQPTHRRPTPSSCPLVARSPVLAACGQLSAALFANPMGSPRFAALLLLLLPHAGTPLSLKNT